MCGDKMEYAYMLVTPKGCDDNVHIKILKDLIKDGKELGLTTLTCAYDLTDRDIQMLYDNTKNEHLYTYLNKNSTNKLIMPLFIKGVDAINKVKQIAYKYNDFSKPELDKSIRYLDKVYVSNNINEVISDFCEYTNIEDFSKIEPLLFQVLNCEIDSFNFKALVNYANKNKKLI